MHGEQIKLCWLTDVPYADRSIDARRMCTMHRIERSFDTWRRWQSSDWKECQHWRATIADHNWWDHAEDQFSNVSLYLLVVMSDDDRTWMPHYSLFVGKRPQRTSPSDQCNTLCPIVTLAKNLLEMYLWKNGVWTRRFHGLHWKFQQKCIRK